MRLINFLILFLIFINSLTCSIDNLDIQFFLPPRSDPDPTRYNLTEIQDQFPLADLKKYSNHLSTSLSCVEAVSQRQIFGTPGGDFG